MIRICFKLIVTALCFIFYLIIMAILFITTYCGFREWTCEWIMIFLKYWEINVGDVVKYDK